MVLCKTVDPCKPKKPAVHVSGDCENGQMHDSCKCTNIFGNDHLSSKRHKKYRSTKRIQTLANPKYYTPKFQAEDVRPFERKIEIIRDCDEPTPVRIKLLAYPKVR